MFNTCHKTTPLIVITYDKRGFYFLNHIYKGEKTMVKKTTICILTILMVLSSAVCSFANTNNLMTTKENGDITIQYQSISRIDFNLTFNGATANPVIRAIPIKGVTVDRVVVDAKLMKAGNSTPVKTWNETVYANVLREFFWTDSHKVASQGTYYLSATIKAYRGSTLLDTITGESGTAVY